MSINSEIARLQTAKSGIASAIAEKGVTVPDGTKLDGMPALIGGIQTDIADVFYIDCGLRCCAFACGSSRCSRDCKTDAG